MQPNQALALSFLLALMPAGVSPVSAAPPRQKVEAPLTVEGGRLEARFEDQLKALRAEIERALPRIDERKRTALQKAGEAIKVAEADAKAAQAELTKIQGAKGLVDHAKGKWIGGAEKGIAQAEAALKKAATDAEREAAKKDLAKWQADKEAGLKALEERQEALDKAKIEEPKVAKANQAAQAALAAARDRESAAFKDLMAGIEPVLANDTLDAKLVKAAVLAGATPRGLAVFAQSGKEQEAAVDALLANDLLMKQMLEAGGAKFGNYGRAMDIYTAIRQASAKSGEGVLQRLALATSVEHAKPIAQNNAKETIKASPYVVPVKRYLHYEKAYLDGELDPAFKTFSTWEMRMVVDCDAPDEILAWGREMLRNYRPDHIYNPDYGWRYSAAVKTEVPYGSQNVQYDLPSLHQHQNIIRNGGVCGRRAFFGRFMLKSFGIPTWGVTQKAHAALSHWTPKGWVVNLGAGYEHSWWDKDEAPRSGSDFLLETQARAHGAEYLKVLRARWISQVLGEEAFNDRKGVAGGFWSGIARYRTVAMASTAVGLGPLGQELGEANEPKEKQKVAAVTLAEDDLKVVVGKDGTITIPAVSAGKPSRNSAAMKSFAGGMQLHCTGGYQAEHVFEAPAAGKYLVSAQVVTVQEGHKAMLAVNDPKSPVELAIPYTLGKWQPTKPLEVTLNKGSNTLYFVLQDGSRGVTLKDFTLVPVK